MVGMLDALDLGDHPRVLEIGTGTGYNAALMCHVLGDAAVHSVDVDPVLVDTARARLDSLGHHPLLAVGDGRAGTPEPRPVRPDHRDLRIPRRCRGRGPSSSWTGGLVLGRRQGGAARGQPRAPAAYGRPPRGHFLPSWAGFMAVRDRDRPPAWQEADPPVGPAVGETETVLDPHPLAASVPWFLAQIGPPPVVTLPPLRARLRGARFVAADGAWCAVSPPEPAAAGRSPGAARGASGTTSSAPTPCGGPTDGRAGPARPHGDAGPGPHRVAGPARRRSRPGGRSALIKLLPHLHLVADFEGGEPGLGVRGGQAQPARRRVVRVALVERQPPRRRRRTPSTASARC